MPEDNSINRLPTGSVTRAVCPVSWLSCMNAREELREQQLRSHVEQFQAWLHHPLNFMSLRLFKLSKEWSIILSATTSNSKVNFYDSSLAGIGFQVICLKEGPWVRIFWVLSHLGRPAQQAPSASLCAVVPLSLCLFGHSQHLPHSGCQWTPGHRSTDKEERTCTVLTPWSSFLIQFRILTRKGCG